MKFDKYQQKRRGISYTSFFVLLIKIIHLLINQVGSKSITFNILKYKLNKYYIQSTNIERKKYQTKHKITILKIFLAN